MSLKTNQQSEMKKGNITSYGADVSFMGNYIDVIQLADASNNLKVAISAALQGRIMTSRVFVVNVCLLFTIFF